MGVVTFARFYAMHVLLLPPATILLIALHVFLVRRHGVAPVPGRRGMPEEDVLPDAGVQGHGGDLRRLRDSVHDGGRGARARWNSWPIPRTPATFRGPSGISCSCSSCSRLFNGPLEVVGAVVLPGLAVLTLLLVPFIDRGAMVKVTKRTFAMAVVLLAAIGWSGLTMAAVKSTPPQEAVVDFSYNTDWMKLTPQQLASSKAAGTPAFVTKGASIYQANHCSACHSVNGAGGKIGPSLNGLSKRQTLSWVEQHFVDPQKLSPGTSMPPYKLSPEDMANLTSYLFSLPDQ